MKTINRILILSVITLLYSCSSNYRRPESIESKMARFKTSDQEHALNIPQLVIFKQHFANRMPASTVEKKQKVVKKSKVAYSNKRLYFLALLAQYYKLRSFSKNTGPEINSCPHFHTAWLTYNEGHFQERKSKNDLKLEKLNLTNANTPNYLAINPILTLPLSNTKNYPKAIDVLEKHKENKDKQINIIKRALDIHIIKNYNELKELCENGNSNNYYNFENLITHVNTNQKLPPSIKGLKILYKTSIFTNMALLHSIKKFLRKKISRKIASIGSNKKRSDIYQREIIHRLDVYWINQYFKTIEQYQTRSN